MKKEDLIIGITGTICAGKGTLVEALQEQGFAHFSVRGFLEEGLEKRGLEKSRDNLVNLANEWREKFGPHYIAERLYEQAQKQQKNAVIESIRNISEVDFLRENAGQSFYLIGIDAPLEMRWRRSPNRGTYADETCREEFIKKDQREMTSNDPNKQNISACMEKADYFFWAEYPPGISKKEEDNRGDKEMAKAEFISGKSGFLNLFDSAPRRPTFDEIFMRQAVEWSDRSTCLSRHTGAVIVDEDNTLISQGYNGAPRGVVHCEDRGGCERRKRDIPSGERLELCYAVHAEANAILNSKQPVIGATMYATNYPCNDCSKVIIQKGIRRVIYLGSYTSELGEIMLKEAGVEMQKYRQGVSPKAYSRIWS